MIYAAKHRKTWATICFDTTVLVAHVEDNN